jgi:hypothetical protein
MSAKDDKDDIIESVTVPVKEEIISVDTAWKDTGSLCQ